jgi:hypothetical protein
MSFLNKTIDVVVETNPTIKTTQIKTFKTLRYEMPVSGIMENTIKNIQDGKLADNLIYDRTPNREFIIEIKSNIVSNPITLNLPNIRLKFPSSFLISLINSASSPLIRNGSHTGFRGLSCIIEGVHTSLPICSDYFGHNLVPFGKIKFVNCKTSNSFALDHFCLYQLNSNVEFITCWAGSSESNGHHFLGEQSFGDAKNSNVFFKDCEMKNKQGNNNKMIQNHSFNLSKNVIVSIDNSHILNTMIGSELGPIRLRIIRLDVKRTDNPFTYPILGENFDVEANIDVQVLNLLVNFDVGDLYVEDFVKNSPYNRHFDKNISYTCKLVNGKSVQTIHKIAVPMHAHSIYSKTDHTHDNVYSKTDHTHDNVYSKTGHNHDNDYSKKGHNHDNDYSKKGHNHDNDYSKTNHNHDDVYADANHTHNDYLTEDDTRLTTLLNTIKTEQNNDIENLQDQINTLKEFHGNNYANLDQLVTQLKTQLDVETKLNELETNLRGEITTLGDELKGDDHYQKLLERIKSDLSQDGTGDLVQDIADLGAKLDEHAEINDDLQTLIDELKKDIHGEDGNSGIKTHKDLLMVEIDALKGKDTELDRLLTQLQTDIEKNAALSQLETDLRNLQNNLNDKISETAKIQQIETDLEKALELQTQISANKVNIETLIKDVEAQVNHKHTSTRNGNQYKRDNAMPNENNSRQKNNASTAEVKGAFPNGMVLALGFLLVLLIIFIIVVVTWK